jgi:hypothetical protein
MFVRRGPFSESLSRWFISDRRVMVSWVFFFVSLSASFVFRMWRVYNACVLCCMRREPRCCFVVHYSLDGDLVQAETCNECWYCNGFDQRVVTQQLCKHGPTRNNRWGCVFCALSLPRGYKRIREWELTSLEFWSSKGTALWPAEEDATCAVVHRYWECVI